MSPKEKKEEPAPSIELDEDRTDELRDAALLERLDAEFWSDVWGDERESGDLWG